MRDGNNTDRATIEIESGRGSPVVKILGSTVVPSDLAAIRSSIGSDTSTTAYSEPYIEVSGCSIALSGSHDADYGFLFTATGEKWADAELHIVNNTVDSSACDSGHGITTGVKVEAVPSGAGNVQVRHYYFFIDDNVIKRCLGDGVWLLADEISATSDSHISIWDFERNHIRDCGTMATMGAGIRLDRGSHVGGYMNVVIRNNDIVHNYLGVHRHGVGESGQGAFTNNTIADNTGVAFYIEDNLNNVPSKVTNNIVFYNNSTGGGQQYGGTLSWQLSDIGFLDYNCWEDLYSPESCDPDDDPNGDHNISAEPGFVDHDGGDYHITASSCVKNKGDNAPDSGESVGAFDIDHQDRIYRGDGELRVDIGADEYQP